MSLLGFVKRIFWRESNGRLPWRVIHEYSDVVAAYGPQSEKAKVLREKFADVEGFKEFAKVRDKMVVN